MFLAAYTYFVVLRQLPVAKSSAAARSLPVIDSPGWGGEYGGSSVMIRALLIVELAEAFVKIAVGHGVEVVGKL
jgi:hypothetical protein